MFSKSRQRYENFYSHVYRTKHNRKYFHVLNSNQNFDIDAPNIRHNHKMFPSVKFNQELGLAISYSDTAEIKKGI